MSFFLILYIYVVLNSDIVLSDHQPNLTGVLEKTKFVFYIFPSNPQSSSHLGSG